MTDVQSSHDQARRRQSLDIVQAGLSHPAFVGMLAITLLFAINAVVQASSPFIPGHDDVWRRSVYLLARMSSVFVILVAFCATGVVVLRFISRDLLLRLDHVEDVVISFVVGSVVLRAAAFLIPLNTAISSWLVPLVFGGMIVAAHSILKSRHAGSESHGSENHSDVAGNTGVSVAEARGNIRLPAYWPLMVAGFLAALSQIWFLPLDGDYLTHYGQYLISVASSGSLAPNDVWYHFFYSRGNALEASLFGFTDVTAKFDVSAAYTMVAIFAVVALVTRAGGGRLGSIAGMLVVVLYYTSFDLGFFGKNHAIVNSGLVMGVFLLSRLIGELDFSRRDTLLYISMLNMIGILLVAPTTLPFAALVAMMSILCIREQRSLAGMIHTFAYLVPPGLLLVGLFASNYLTIGLYEITPSQLFFDLMDYGTFTQHHSAYLITFLELGSDQGFGGIRFDPSIIVEKVISSFHLTPILGAFGFLWVILFLAMGAFHFVSDKENRALGFLIVSPILACALALLLVSQPVSVYRATAFAGTFAAIILAVGVSHFGQFASKGLVRQRTVVWVLVAILMVGVAQHPLRFQIAQFSNLIAGGSTYEDYYAATPLTGPGTEIGVRLKERYGVDTKILTTSLVSNRLGRAYLMGNGIKSEVSYGLGKDWAFIASQPAERAFPVLWRHADIVLLNLEMIGVSAIGFSPLLSVESIEERFVIVDSDGAWLALAPADSGFEGRDMTDAEAASWRGARRGYFSYLAESLREIYKFNGSQEVSHKPLLPPDFTRPAGWQ